ncbi:Rhs protein [Streptomyces montanus]|uniref:Rhs protein n=1 Tax=Streptomyces montanus TaxID=2580423 RepID=A0A5R9FVT6_9ACTN|nr:RHS repeat-associated core domain-containing protein [Streptomyces montanus]TLS46789.1 Rhs protein [Streptomyces montanus]
MAGYRPTDWHVLDLEKDPTPGDPDRVRSLAKSLHDFADDVQDALRLVKGMAEEEAVLTWVGKTAEVFQDEFSGVPKNLKKLKKSYDLAGDALAAYWPKLERAQALADKALAKGREAQADLSSAKSRLSTADSWVSRATKEADKYKEDKDAGKDVPKPDEDKVRAATRDAQNAESAQTSAQSDVNSAQSALDAAKKMAADARQMREDAAGEAKRKLDEASDAGIQNRKWYEEVGDWVSDNWDTIVAVCKVVVAVLGVIAMIIGGPILGAIVLIAALVVLADTLNKYAKGQASLWDVAFAALDCIPGMKGLTSLGGLAKGLKALGKTGLKGMAKAAKGGMNKLRQQAQKMAERRCKSDPIDVVTGEMVASAVDVELAGALPLVIERHHVSSFRGGRWFGPSWSSVLDQRLLLDADGIRLITEDGMVLHYPVPEPGLPVMPVMGPRWPLEWSGAPDGSMTVLRPETGETLRFRSLPERPAAELPLAAITDRNDNAITFEYHPDGTPRAVVHEGGYRVGVEVTNGRVTALRLVSDPAEPVVVRYGYDSRGNLSEIYNSSGQPLRLSYDDHHRIVAWQDRKGTHYQYVYDSAGRCVRTVGSEGFHNGTFEYDTAGGTTIHTDSLGHTTAYRYNGDFRITSETDALGHVTTTEWDAFDRMLSQTDALGRTTGYAYDADGNLSAVIRPDGLRISAEYNELRLPVRITEADEGQWRFGYDGKGNLLSVTDPSGAVTRRVYDSAGRATAATDALGHTRRYEHDSLGRPTVALDALGATTRFTYNAFGRLASVTDSTTGVTRFGWTPEGQMAWRTTPSGATERWAHDAEGNETEHRDAAGAVTRFEYTHFDLLAACTRPDGTRVEFGHDTELRLTSVTDARGRTWRYEYDAVGNTVRETDFSGRVLTYVYDAANQLAARTNALGQTTHYLRDALGNIVEQRDEDAVARFAYDALGRPVRAENPDAVVIRAYDAMGRITEETCNGRTLHSAYDALGRRTHRRTPTGALSTWEYDANDRPTLLRTAGQLLSMGYDGAGRETELRVGAAVLTQGWDGDHRLVAQALTGVPEQSALRRQYTYRADDHPTEIADNVAGHRRLELDAAARVTAVHAESWTEQYAYDAAGDLTHTTWPASPAARSDAADAVVAGADAADAMGGRSYGPLGVRQAGRTTYEHDAQGRITRRGSKSLSGGSRTWRYHWNDQDQLREVITPDGRHWRYLYDPFGRRIAKQLLGDDGTVTAQTDFTWDGTDLAEQTSSLDGRVVSWDWSSETGRPVAQTERQVTADTAQDEIDARFYAIVTDLVGAPTELIAPDGRTGWRLRTTLWGVPSSAPAPTPGGETDCPLRFPGQYRDDETGLHYNYFRYYDPALGRYCSLDPLGLGGGPNPGWYTPNPTVWIDPFGLALCRKPPRLDDGDLKKGWIHIEGRHITGTNPSTKHADMLPPTTTRAQVHEAAAKIVKKGTRISDPSKRIQTYEMRTKVNGMRGRFSVTVDSHDSNNIITFFPVGKSFV